MNKLFGAALIAVLLVGVAGLAQAVKIIDLEGSGWIQGKGKGAVTVIGQGEGYMQGYVTPEARNGRFTILEQTECIIGVGPTWVQDPQHPETYSGYGGFSIYGIGGSSNCSVFLTGSEGAFRAVGTDRVVFTAEGTYTKGVNGTAVSGNVNGPAVVTFG